MRTSKFIPSLPTLWPQMLWSQQGRKGNFPFAARNVRYFYFARNAVWLSVKLLGLEGQEVLVPSYHHGVEVEALVDAGAIPRFFRVGSRWDVDLEDVKKKITSKTRAIYLIHYAGFPGPVQQLRELADQHGIPLIEDCALSLFSQDGDVPLGSTGNLGIFCLYKTLPVPNGGALVVNAQRSYAVPEALTPPWPSTLSHLMSSLLQNLELRGGAAGRWIRQTVRGMGRRTVQAASIERVGTGTQHFNRAHVDLGMSPLTQKIAFAQDVSQIVERRRRNYFFLLGRLRDVAPPLFGELAPGVCPLFYPLIVPNKGEVYAQLAARGVEAIDFWRHFHPACNPQEFPEVAELRRTVLELPCHQDLDPEAMQHIVEVVKDAVPAQRRVRVGGL